MKPENFGGKLIWLANVENR